MDAALPSFRYHADPVGSGAFARITHTCRCCGERRGWAYTVVPYATENLRDALCPWCVADGSAAERFGARFTDLEPGDVPADVPEEVVEEIVSRTPGFSGWDRERWLFHCGDAAVFLGPVGWVELEEHPDVVAQLRDDVVRAGGDPLLAEAFVGSLDVDGASLAYLFRCRHCGGHLAYADTDSD